MSNKINRRNFLTSAALAGTAGALGVSSCNRTTTTLQPLRLPSEWNLAADSLPEKAIDGRELKVGLVGCGGQGTGDLLNLLRVADGIKVAALGDMFMDRINSCRERLQRVNQTVPDEKCFTGFDAYQKVIDAGVDMVMLVTAPAFRPMHFKAAVDAGKHVFNEKPMAVDPAGIKSILVSSRQADAQGLCVINGTQRHHQRVYFEGYKQVQSGLIGDIVGGQVYWNQSQLWFRTKEAGWTDMEWMVRDWVNWNWLSGDHIVEQHIHNIDVFNWFSHLKPVKATGFGARHRRVTGDQFDMFCIDFTYEGGIHVLSTCRQINGCNDNVSERIQGSKGVWTSNGVITDLNGKELWRYDWEKEKEEFQQTNEYVLQLVNWVNHIRSGKPINQAEETTISSLTGIMGRQSAYTGRDVTWDEIYNSDLNLVPENLELKNMDMTQYPIPVPGVGRG